MSELEAACVEIGRERKSITASLKDLDSVVSKLDAILLFFVFAVTVLVVISLISTSAAGVLTSAGSAVSTVVPQHRKRMFTRNRFWHYPGCFLVLLRSSCHLVFSFSSNIRSTLEIASTSMVIPEPR